MPDQATLLARLASGRTESLTHVEVLPARPATPADWPTWLAPELRDLWIASGIERPWHHQRVTADLVHSGTPTMLATGTSSGKSLAYLMPALDAIQRQRGPKGERRATALYIAPTKALANDQFTKIDHLGVPGLRVSTHDGDSSPEARVWARNHGEYLLTNPDMLHRSLLPRHQHWSDFLGALRFIIVDECHHYRGIFGAHVALILRRLRRVAQLHGADPTFVLASATVADPKEAAERLIGASASAVTDDGSPRGRITLGLWEPPFTAAKGENQAPTRRSATYEVADLMTDLVIEGVRTLAFVRSRQGVEAVAVQSKQLLTEVDPELASSVAAYRGGYLPEERRALEDSLRSGRLRGLATTSALELGIDIAGLDAVLLAGFPGTRAAMWQQLGRAGRRGADALGVLVARDDPLDTYLVTHPEVLLGQPIEASVFDPDNPLVLAPHLCAAAAEQPLTPADLPVFGPRAEETLTALVEARLLRKRPSGWFWTDRRRASDLADLRSSGGHPVHLVEESSGRVLGTVDEASAPATAHPGATHLHQGDTYVVQSLDLDDRVAVVRREQPPYFTSARSISDLEIRSVGATRAWGPATLNFGLVEVTQQVVSYLKRKHGSGEVIGEVPLDLPAQTLETASVWWTLPEETIKASGLAAADLPGAAHAAEHAAIGLLPLFATCSRWDIGGLSTALHPDTGMLTVFVHDGYPGGAGFSQRGFEMAGEWLRATVEAIRSCPCTQGCPSCVQSPKCGNQNNPLDKSGAIVLLELLLSEAN